MILPEGKETVLVIPDLQCPFEHKDACNFLEVVRDRIRPTRVVCIGDSIDAHAMARWPADPDGRSAKDEYELAMVSMAKLYDIFPKAVEVRSNHNMRIAKRIFDAGLPSSFLRSYEELMQYPAGWSLEDYVVIDDVLYEHGHSQGGVHAALNLAVNNGQSTVIGHHHSHGGVQYRANRTKTIFGMNSGCLIDIDEYAFKYAKDAKHKPTLGCGVVIRGVPFFVPMLIDNDKRWTGKLFLP